jgi:hypothetical protein
MAGYSGTPLPRKLGLKEGQRLVFIRPPSGLAELLGPLPEKARFVEEGETVDFALLFVFVEAELRQEFSPLMKRLAPAGMLWVAWPKRASKYPTDLTEDRIRAIALDAGLVDVKVCAIDDFWSGLKLVRRLSSR